MIGQLIAIGIMVLGYFCYAWIGDVFDFAISPSSYIVGCLVTLGASLLWES
jgi:hypothetical protein